MERSVNDVHLHIHNRITAQHAVKHRFVDALFHRGDVFPRNDAADDLVFDKQPFASFGRTHVDFHMPILTTAS